MAKKVPPTIIDTITSGTGLEAEVEHQLSLYTCCGCKLEGDVCLELLMGVPHSVLQTMSALASSYYPHPF